MASTPRNQGGASAPLAFIDALLAPQTKDDWLDRRAGLEAEQRRAEGEALALNWLRKNDPRFSEKRP